MNFNFSWASFKEEIMLIKRPPQFTSFVENKFRHEHVMIMNLYIVSRIL